MDTSKKQEMPAWARTVDAITSYLTEDFLGGPRICKMATPINLHKGASVFVVALMMVWYGNFSTAAWVYLALHGTYGFCWLLKHYAFPDRSWEVKITAGGAVVTFLVLATYWVAPYLLISGVLGPQHPAPSAPLLSLCIGLYAFGLVMMMGSDCQKFFTLKYHSGLITDGFFRYVRHPNHLGEMLIYGSFALLVQHWIPWAILLWWWFGKFLVNMLKAESSISRYPEWEAYKARTGMVIPKLFSGRAQPTSAHG